MPGYIASLNSRLIKAYSEQPKSPSISVPEEVDPEYTAEMASIEKLPINKEIQVSRTLGTKIKLYKLSSVNAEVVFYLQIGTVHYLENEFGEIAPDSPERLLLITSTGAGSAPLSTESKPYFQELKINIDGKKYYARFDLLREAIDAEFQETSAQIDPETYSF